MNEDSITEIRNNIESNGIIFTADGSTLGHMHFTENKAGMVDIPKYIIDDNGNKRKIKKIENNGWMFCSANPHLSHKMQRSEIGIVLNIPDTVQKIERRTFYDDHYISEIVLPNTITEIGLGAFQNSDLQRLPNWPSKCAVIPSQCFAQSKLRSFTVPQGLEKIANDAFSDSELEVIDFSDCEFATINAVTFDHCPYLTKIILPYHFYLDKTGKFEYKELENVLINPQARPIPLKPIEIRCRNFAITGKFCAGLSYIKGAIWRKGGNVMKKVTKETDYLVVGQDPGKEKLNDSIKHNTKTLTEAEIIDLLK